MGQGTAPE